MTKYIVKNCPSAYQDYRMRYLCDYNYDKPCKDCTDCLIKQVIEKMKEHPFCDCSCGDEILQLFEIEECE